jgi:hypothetical protein
VRACARRFDQGEQGASPTVVCAGKSSAAQPWQRHNTDDMRTIRDKDGWTTSGEVRTTRVCAHTTPGQRKAGPWLDGGALSVWVPAANRSSATHVEPRNDTTARQRSARGDDGSGTCKRPARLDDRLSSDDESARWREQAAGNIQTASSQGSVQPRLEGWVHNKVKGVEAHLALLDTVARRW